MKNYLLEEKIKDIQSQYLDLLKVMVPLIEDEEYVVTVLDSIALFWRKNKTVISMYLMYLVKEGNAVFYTAATYFDVANGEQYPFLLMGDLHIFDDPLGRYCEICHQGGAPEAFSEKVSICAKDNIDILEKCEGLIVVLPLRYMGKVLEEKEFLKFGEKAFLEFFNDVPNIKTYFDSCNTVDEVIEHFKVEYQQTVCLFENDVPTIGFRSRIERAAEMTRKIMGDGYTTGEYFYFSLFGPLQQAMDIIMVTVEYNAIPLVRYPVTLHNIYLLLPNFVTENLHEITSRLFVFNALYKMFDQSKYMNESLGEFYASVKKYSFEKKVMLCYEENNLKQTLDKIHLLVEDFERWKVREKDTD